MTASATRFVGAPSFRGRHRQPGADRPVGGRRRAEPHVFLGDWAQLILLAPATANVIGRIASGQSDDIVTATLLAARCPVVVAPAMNDAMWSKQAVQENVATLRQRGMTVVEPESGHLASGHVGRGPARRRRRRCCDAMAARGAVALRPRRAARRRHRRRHARADRPGALHQQLLERQDGLCARGGGGGPRRAGDAGDDRDASGAHGVEVRPVETADEMLAELRRAAGRRRPAGDGRGGRRLPAGQGRRAARSGARRRRT